MTAHLTILALVALSLAADPLTAQAREPGGSDPRLELSCAAFPGPVGEAWLIERFGAENVVTDTVVGADDAPFLGTVVFASVPMMRLDVAWQDSTRTAARWIRGGGGSGWRTIHGFAMGADLRSVEGANGGPFRLRGFSVEGGLGGAVLSWGQGSFHAPDPGQRCREVIIFQHAYDGSADPSMLRQVDRLHEVSSGHPAM